ncbi:hypothetical protein DYBT9275_03141 [Dyadobacter sp. CECT 9275]|uniref:PepSY domain-containing protein n=1 Tax=Dyadobacter helix TaxID=2822344 RepID=A0A916N537_9BACT|nr:PepSY-associated TM helix domain-containing protein [Dyadobacter sp. CECT 9275]CAG5003391.1 hypothetical protein DYBT9275_03141 [Dyadobacter sp. CECT 9275]
MKILKKINAWLHLWLGLASGIVVVIVSFTGCILVFESEIKDWYSAHLFAENPENKPMLPPSRLWQTARQAMPGKVIQSVWYHGEGRTAHFYLNSDSLVYVNPYNGNLVAIVDHEDFFDFILEGHTELWIHHEAGAGIVKYATLIFFVLLITGLILWWPKKWNRSHTDKSFKIKWKAKFKRVNYDLHNVLGFYSLLIALIISATGLIMGFSWFSKSVYWLSSGGETPAPSIRSFSDTTRFSQLAGLENVDKAWKKGTEEIGVYNKEAIIVSFPDEISEPISLCTDMINGSWRYVYLDQHTLEELPGTQPQIDKLNIADWIRRTNYALHVGSVGNLTTKILYFIASLISTSLPITGFYIWWEKERKKRKKRTKKLPGATKISL